jgi:hypothetical protein
LAEAVRGALRSKKKAALLPNCTALFFFLTKLHSVGCLRGKSSFAFFSSPKSEMK